MLPIVVWPGLVRPFSSPKLLLVVLIAAVLAWFGSPGWSSLAPALRWSALGWIATFVIAALASDLPALGPLVLGVAAPLLALGALRASVAPLALVRAMVVGATACAGVAVLQWAGHDPFVWAGWHAPVDGASVRMRVYGTLGNPNFVGALMAMSLPLAAAVHRETRRAVGRRVIEVSLGLQALALVATGSRGAVLGLCAAAAIYAFLRWSRRVRLAVGALIVFAGIAVISSPARPLDTTAAGRLHLWRVALLHAAESPFTGLGPGAVTLHFPAWQRDAARTGVRDPRFAGPTDHVHNDYLEALIERGMPGLLALVLPLGFVLVRAVRCRRPASPLVAGSCAAVIAGAACAVVDFPLARPTELTWWWVALAVALQATANPASGVTFAPAAPTPYKSRQDRDSGGDRCVQEQ